MCTCAAENKDLILYENVLISKAENIELLKNNIEQLEVEIASKNDLQKEENKFQETKEKLTKQWKELK